MSVKANLKKRCKLVFIITYLFWNNMHMSFLIKVSRLNAPFWPVCLEGRQRACWKNWFWEKYYVAKPALKPDATLPPYNTKPFELFCIYAGVSLFNYVVIHFIARSYYRRYKMQWSLSSLKSHYFENIFELLWLWSLCEKRFVERYSEIKTN